jgi:hypothetical protein
VQEICRTDDVGLPVARKIVFPHDGETIGVAIGKTLQQERVDHAEDGGVGADADRERGNCDQREARRPEQQANAVA